MATKFAAGSSGLDDAVRNWIQRKERKHEWIWYLHPLLFFLIKYEKSNVSWGIMILSCITYLLLQIKVMMLFFNLFWRRCVWKYGSLKAQKVIQQPRQVFWHTWVAWILLILVVTYHMKTKLFLPWNLWTNHRVTWQCQVNGWTQSF